MGRNEDLNRRRLPTGSLSSSGARAFLPRQQAERASDIDSEMSDPPRIVRTEQTATHEERRDE